MTNHALTDIERDNMMAKLGIEPPLELWLSNSITWKEKAEKLDILYISKLNNLFSDYLTLEQELKDADQSIIELIKNIQTWINLNDTSLSFRLIELQSIIDKVKKK